MNKNKYGNDNLVQVYMLLPPELRGWNEELGVPKRTFTCFVETRDCLREFKILVENLKPRYAELGFHDGQEWISLTLLEGINEIEKE